MGDGRRSKHLPTWYMDGYGYGFIGSLGISWGYSGAWDMMGYLTNNIQLLLYGGSWSLGILCTEKCGIAPEGMTIPYGKITQVLTNHG